MRKCVPSFVFVICVLVSAMELQAATLFIDPVTQNIPPIGETLIVDVIVEGVADLGGYGFDMVFDATALKYTDMEEGEFLKEDGTTTMFIQKTDEASDGILKIAGLRFGSPPPAGVDGSGRLASVTFEVLTIKTSVIIFQNVKLHRPDLGIIDVDLVNGSIVVPMVYTIMATSGNHGNISPTGELIVTEGGSQVFAINPDICYHVADVVVDGASVGAVDTYTFPNVTSRHTITAAFAIDTYTITAAAGANGSITPSGTVTVNCGAPQKYAITPGDGYHVVDVLVNGNSVGTVSTYTFSDIRADQTIEATFAVNTYIITATSGNHGNISPTGELIVTEGGSQVFSINPDICYHVADIVVDGVSVGVMDTYTFPNVTSGHTITATFAIDTYTITATAGANGSITPSGIVTVDCGVSQKYAITPEDGYHIVDVLVNGNSVGTVSTYTFSDIRADQTIEATFAVNTYTITATSGNHGNISPTGELIVTEGGSQVFAINPDICYHVADIVVDGVSVGVMDTYTFPDVISGHTIAATFAIDTYTITATAGANGSITPSGIVTVDCGVSQKYAMTPEDGYHIVDVLVDGRSIGAVSEYIFEEVTSDHEITATFASSDGRSVEPTGKQLGEWGDIKRTTLYQNFPNPFNPDTWIPYQLSEAANVSITIYDITAKVIKNIDLGEKPAGRYRTKETAAHWDGRNEVGEPVVSGIYFAVLRARDCQQIRRMLLLK